MRVSVTESGSVPPLWPPLYQVIATVAPAAAICRALASAWSSPKRVSFSPCTNRVGALICEATALGLELASKATNAGVIVPVWAACA